MKSFESKLTKKFHEMTVKERIKEGLKMYFFADVIANEYCHDKGFYNYVLSNFDLKEDMLAAVDMAKLRIKLIETQKLLAKYNCEDMIMGHEVIKKDDVQYKTLIEPFKVNIKGNKMNWFNVLFKKGKVA
jgi:hypothetical protein